jgi:hypothetical protein
MNQRDIKELEDCIKDIWGTKNFQEVFNNLRVYNYSRSQYEKWLKMIYWALPAQNKSISNKLVTFNP